MLLTRDALLSHSRSVPSPSMPPSPWCGCCGRCRRRRCSVAPSKRGIAHHEPRAGLAVAAGEPLVGLGAGGCRNGLLSRHAALAALARALERGDLVDDDGLVTMRDDLHAFSFIFRRAKTLFSMPPISPCGKLSRTETLGKLSPRFWPTVPVAAAPSLPAL